MQRTKVLLVEDNPTWLTIFRTLIGDATQELFEYTCVGDLKSALASLQEQEPSLILLDLMLPDSHARDTIKTMSVHARHIPTVIITTLDDESLMANAFQSGIEDYLVKDQYSLQTFLHVSRQAIRRFLGNTFQDNMDNIFHDLQLLDSKLKTMEQNFTKLDADTTSTASEMNNVTRLHS